jgi:tetratricopeptide (TPR) repeat protein
MTSSAGMLSQIYYALGRLEDADAWAERTAAVIASDDPDPVWRQVRAKVLARRGAHAEAERLARQATEIIDATDWLGFQADAYADLAEVLALGGNSEGAAEALELALARYDRKENLVMARRVRARLKELTQSESHAERI